MCAICAITTSDVLHVDHCHTTGKIRGLLCHQCNVLLGASKDSITTLQNAIKYLGEYNRSK